MVCFLDSFLSGVKGGDMSNRSVSTGSAVEKKEKGPRVFCVSLFQTSNFLNGISEQSDVDSLVSMQDDKKAIIVINRVT